VQPPKKRSAADLKRMRQVNVKGHTKDNTPLPRGSRAKLWEEVKRLAGHHPGLSLCLSVCLSVCLSDPHVLLCGCVCMGVGGWGCAAKLIEGKGEFTHQCMLYMGTDTDGTALHCNTMLKLGYQYDPHEFIDAETQMVKKSQKRKWITTKGIDHYETDHSNHPIAQARVNRKNKQARKRVLSLGPASDIQLPCI